VAFSWSVTAVFGLSLAHTRMLTWVYARTLFARALYARANGRDRAREGSLRPSDSVCKRPTETGRSAQEIVKPLSVSVCFCLAEALSVCPSLSGGDAGCARAHVARSLLPDGARKIYLYPHTHTNIYIYVYAHIVSGAHFLAPSPPLTNLHAKCETTF
jgi:hypothetical protein